MYKSFVLIPLAGLLIQGVYAQTERFLLEDSVVSASGFEQDIKEAPASISVIKRGDLESKPYRDVAEAIADIPGVDLFASKGKTGSYNITMRGITGYTLILVDGRRQSVGGEVGPNGFNEVTSAFLPPISAIERIEVIKGPMSTLYGSDALGGVVNIVTKKTPQKWGVSLQTEALFQQDSSWGNTYGVSVYGSGPIRGDKLGLTLRAREFYRAGSDVTYTRPDGKILEANQAQSPTRANNHNVGVRLDYLLRHQDSITFDVDYSKSIFDNANGQLGTLTKPLKNGGLTGGYTKTMQIDKLVTFLRHQGIYESFTLDSALQYNRVTNDGREVVGLSTQPHLGKNRDIIAEDIIADMKAILPLGERNILSTGIEYRVEKMQDNIANPTKFDQYLLGIFAEDEFSLSQNAHLTFGARYNKHEVFGNNLSPRVYFVYNPSQALTLKGGVATGFKAPQPNRLIAGYYNFSGQGRFPVYGNPSLKEETSLNYELGAIYNWDSYYLSATGFLTDFKDKISSTSVNKGGQISSIGECTYDRCFQAINHGEVRYMGLELAGGVTFYEKLNADISYTYLDSEVQESSIKKDIGKPERNTLKHNIVSKIGYKVHNFHPYIKGQWQGRRYTGGDAAIGDYYKNVFLLGVGMTYAINDAWKLNVAVHNLLDKSFTDSFVQDKERKTYVSQYNRIEEGRRLWVSLTGSF
ncbi:TonB-dependent receptor domain-containing protein [Helicobacter sp.]|uniref:TonB-dependent receptor domain-containing protein n=1 Tax=Helicobacter sp. TaxID=218 RepID=UPI0025BE87D4|nr:TonB-dependent receptor [Helicobacter sp.]MCI5968067.1 TonB-dependent receptor [Helicobacter sp.]MDY2584042.1 TonB-dependent receptor [Helicobacter sp.]